MGFYSPFPLFAFPRLYPLEIIPQNLFVIEGQRKGEIFLRKYSDFAGIIAGPSHPFGFGGEDG